MQVSAADSGSPLFLLGTGRCGSTFWQSLFSRAPGVWIWGEHGGLMRPLLATRAQAARKFCRPDGPTVSPAEMQAPIAESGPRLAWANCFTREDLDDVLRGAVLAIFGQGLPPGTSRWGFKELRYVHDTARHHLDLFPGGSVVHTLRHPRATLESMIVTWHRDAVTADNDQAIGEAYATHAAEWLRKTEELLALANLMPDRVVLIRLEEIDAARFIVAEKLGIQLPSDHPPVNMAPSAVTPRTRQILAPLWADWSGKLSVVATRAGYSDVQSLSG